MAYASWSIPLPARFSEDVPEPTTGTRSIVSERDDVEAYLPLVRRLARRVHRKVPPNVLLDDLVSAGTLGLLDALRRFDGVRDQRFEWYLHVRIRGAILDELRRLDWLSRRQRAAMASDSSTHGAVAIVAFEELPAHHRDLASPDAASPADLAEQRLHGVALAAAIARLPEREGTIVSMHYYEGHALKEIATVLGVSEARVSQLHLRALALLHGLMAPTGAA
jgi:RNA polymerase sigma factor for flagellar operon FliA